MPIILNPQLLVSPVPDQPPFSARRRVVVSYELDIEHDDVLIGESVIERAVIVARDLHDAPVPPRELRLEVDRSDLRPVPGRCNRRLSFTVNRTELDVEEDWWRTGNGGEIEAISELPDHLVAEVSLIVHDEVVAEATTPVLTGSWGALGSD
jgi:hypothetical protein